MSERFRDIDWSREESEPAPRTADEDPYAAREFELRDYDPIHPHGFSFRKVLGRIWAVLIAVGVATLKFGAFSIKFFGVFISVAAYALIWGWRFAVGFVVLIFVHEMGHFLEARRQGLKPALPVFVPFLGAYVAIKDAPHDPWRNGLISIAGPILGGLGALACLALGNANDSDLLRALGYSGFLLNLFNLIPIFPFDGGFIASSTRALWRHGPRARAIVLGGGYVILALLLVLGMMSAHVSQDRL
ncbi:MAG TPA: site-2 protease family protein [Gaiellaceae bacterium]|nr:site-2 protease family protein [Gaiellaceae bacterium]